MATLTDINGIGPALAKRLVSAGVTTVGAVASATPASLAEVQGLSTSSARAVIAEAKKVGTAKQSAQKKAPAKKTAAKKGAPPISSDKANAKLDNRVAKLEKRLKKLEKKMTKVSKATKSQKKSKKK